MALGVNTTIPITPTLTDLVGAGQGGAGAAGPPGVGASASSTSGSAAVAIGQNGALDLNSVDALALSLNRATGIADVAIGAGQTVQGLLAHLQADAGAAQDPALDASSRDALNADFKARLGQIGATIDAASFDGVNLVNGQPSAGLKLPDAAGGGLTLSAQDLSLGGPIVTVGATASLGTAGAAASALGDVSTSLANLQAALDALTGEAGQIAAHGAIVNRLSGALQAQTEANASDSTDGARLLALQIQQGLNADPQPIANQSPQLVLSLFR